MAECFLHIGMDESTLDGDLFPLVYPLSTLIPDTHEHLFRFMDYDLFLLEEPLKKYLSCLDDGSNADKKLLRPVIRGLRELHPYFMLSSENIQALLNSIFANHILARFPKQDLTAQRDMFTRVAIKQYSVNREPEEMIPSVEETLLEGVLTEEILTEKEQRILETLFNLQDRIRRLVFFTLDDTNEYLADLPISRRTALYSLAYPSDSLAHIEADFSVRPSEKMRSKILDLEFDNLDALKKKLEEKAKKAGKKYVDADVNSYQSGHERLKKAFNELYWNSNASIPPALREAILATVDAADQTEITYYISSFANLLELEVYRMITAETHIRRCEKCREYFVPSNKDQKSCKSCSDFEHDAQSEAGSDSLITSGEISSEPVTEEPVQKATPKKTSSKGNKRTKSPLGKSPCYKPYRTRYKTLSARVQAGKMTAEDLEKWRQVAIAKLQLVIDGKLDPDEYREWLKK